MPQRRQSFGLPVTVLALALVAGVLAAPSTVTGHTIGASRGDAAANARHRSCHGSAPTAIASSEQLIPDAPEKMVLCEEVVKYTAPRHGHRIKHVEVLGPRTITKTAALQNWTANFNALPPQPPICQTTGPGPYSCPAFLVGGSKLLVTVKYADEPSLALTVMTSGRRTVERTGIPARSANNAAGRSLVSSLEKVVAAH